MTAHKPGSAANVGVDAHARDGDGYAYQRQHAHHVMDCTQKQGSPNPFGARESANLGAAVTQHLRADRNRRQLTGGQRWPDVTRSDMYMAWSTTRSTAIPAYAVSRR